MRALAAQGGVSPSTVAAALAELRRRGLVVTDGRRGTRVATPAPAGAGAGADGRCPRAPATSRAGTPTRALLPDIAAALARCAPPARLYGEPPVAAGARAAGASSSSAVVREDQELCVVSGALEGLELVLQSSLRPGDRVAVENPGYASLFDLLRANGLRLQPVPVDERGMRPDALEAALRAGAAAAVMTPRGQNPTGALLDGARARRARGGARPPPAGAGDRGRPPRHARRRAPAQLARATAARWAIATSVSKALGPDLRLALLRGDPHTVARVQRRQQCGPGWVSYVLQSLVVDAVGQPLGAAAAGARPRALPRAPRGAARAPATSAGSRPAATSGLNVWVPVPEESAVVAGLLSRGWVVAPGALFRLGSSPTAVRVTTATLTAEESQRLADDLAEILLAGASRSG